MRLSEQIMQRPDCGSTRIRKNGHRKGKQNHICADCRRQFIDDYQLCQGYSDEVRRDCLKMDVNGMGFRGIERVKGVHHINVLTHSSEICKARAIPASGSFSSGNRSRCFWFLR